MAMSCWGAIESLGHSAAAYQAAKERLGRKFCGQRCQIALYLEEIDNFRPVHPGNSKDIERYADLLDIARINLKKANHLEDGLLYMTLQCFNLSFLSLVDIPEL